MEFKTPFVWRVPEEGFRWVRAVPDYGNFRGEGLKYTQWSRVLEQLTPVQAETVEQQHAAWLSVDGVKKVLQDRVQHPRATPDDIAALGQQRTRALLMVRAEPTHVHPYSPLEDQPGLFMRFAHLKPTAEDVLRFADKFGMLVGGDQPILAPWRADSVAPQPLDDKPFDPFAMETLFRDGVLVPAEQFETWRKEIETMKAAVRLWVAVQEGNEDKIRGLFTFGRDEQEPYMTYAQKRRVHTGPLVEAAQDFVDWFIDDAISASLYPTHAQQWKRYTTRKELVQLRYRRGFRIEPPNLLGVMWLQFANAVHDRQRFRECPSRNCRTVWFPVAPQGHRGGGVRHDAKVCSKECGHTLYRDRKAAAVALHKEGRLSPFEIARQLGIEGDKRHTPQQKVQSWIRKRRRA